MKRQGAINGDRVEMRNDYVSCRLSVTDYYHHGLDHAGCLPWSPSRRLAAYQRFYEITSANLQDNQHVHLCCKDELRLVPYVPQPNASHCWEMIRSISTNRLMVSNSRGIIQTPTLILFLCSIP